MNTRISITAMFIIALVLSPVCRAEVTLEAATSTGVIAKITPAAADNGVKSVYMGAEIGGNLYLRGASLSDWKLYVPGSPLPIAAYIVTGSAVPSVTVQVTDMDISALVGLNVYVAYGASENEALNGAGHLAKIYTVPEPAPTPTPTPAPNPTIFPIGVKVFGANQLPAGCDHASQQCWKNALASGLVKLVATKAVMTGYNNRPIVFAYFRNTSCAFGVCGMWNILPIYADDLSLTGSDIFGGGSVELDWVETDPSPQMLGVIVHDKTGCYHMYWDPPPAYVWSVLPVSCPS